MMHVFLLWMHTVIVIIIMLDMCLGKHLYP